MGRALGVAHWLRPGSGVWLRGGIVLAAVGITLGSAWFSMRQIHQVSLALLPGDRGGQAVILDPGHGGMDGGAVGVDGVVEKELNLSIAGKLREILSLHGFRVIMTRETDVSIYDEGTVGLGNQKRSDMHNRLRLMREHPDAIFLSIHQNQFEESQYHGAQMFYSPNHPGSQQLAQQLQQQFVAYLQPENTRKIKEAGQELFLLYHAQAPAVLVECGFLSNPEECRRLQGGEYQDQIAFTIFTALMRYCNGQPDGTGMTPIAASTDDGDRTAQRVWNPFPQRMPFQSPPETQRLGTTGEQENKPRRSPNPEQAVGMGMGLNPLREGDRARP